VTWHWGLLLPLGFAAIAASPGPRHRSRVHVIEISGMAFHPNSLEVARGDTIIWVNHDIVPHTSTAARKSGWNRGQLQQGQRYLFIPRRAGREEYRCELHPTMVAWLIVD
jgi:plastocyanin